jgi:hypothetical protein
MSDFTQTKKSKEDKSETWETKDKQYALIADSKGYFYPYRKNWGAGKDKYGNMVHSSYDYTWTPEKCLQVLNMVLAGLWKDGQGTKLNGMWDDNTKVNYPESLAKKVVRRLLTENDTLNAAQQKTFHKLCMKYPIFGGDEVAIKISKTVNDGMATVIALQPDTQGKSLRADIMPDGEMTHSKPVKATSTDIEMAKKLLGAK